MDNITKYLYAVTDHPEDLDLGEQGILQDGKPAKLAIERKGDFAIAYSLVELTENEPMQANRKNLLSHQKALEILMEDATVVPFAFGTIAHGSVELDDILAKQHDYFVEKLQALQGKVEFGLKLLWKDLNTIYEDISNSNLSVKSYKQKLLNAKRQPSHNEKIELGQLVEKALLQRKEELNEEAIEILEPACIDIVINKNISEAMFFNGAMLIDKKNEPQLDDKVNTLAEKLGENVTVKYVGPLAPYNFLNENN